MPVAEPPRYGIAELSEDAKKVLRCVEKPKEPKSNLAVIGVYAFNHKSFEVYPKLKPSWRNEMEITDAISLLIDSGFKVVPHCVEGWRKDTGKPEDVFVANQLVWDVVEASNGGKNDGERDWDYNENRSDYTKQERRLMSRGKKPISLELP
jgi:glucose-1-phosphate thymidylyltransferase